MIAETFAVVVDLLARKGTRWGPSQPGCLELDIDERWHVAINGDHERRPDASGTLVPGLMAIVRYDNNPIGAFSAVGGYFIVGIYDKPGSVERAFIKACRAAGPQLEPPPEPPPKAPKPKQMLLGGLD